MSNSTHKKANIIATNKEIIDPLSRIKVLKVHISTQIRLLMQILGFIEDKHGWNALYGFQYQ